MTIRTKLNTLLILFFVFLFLYSTAGVIAQVNQNWVSVADRVNKALNRALDTYKEGNAGEAAEEVADAYFGIFEGEDANMEIAVRRHLSLKRAAALEKAFTNIRKAMHSKTSVKDVHQMTRDLIEGLKKAAHDLDRKGVGFDVGYQ